MKRSTSLIELREANLDDGSSNMRRARSQQDLAALGRQSGTSTPSTPSSGNATRMPMLSEKELRDHFNMPLNEVAKKFGMCTTALKKLCRKYGVMQWPHRKLRSLEKKIASLRAEQRYTTDGHETLDDDIRKLEQQREALITGNGEFVDDDKAWSPSGPGSPGELEDTDLSHQDLSLAASKPKNSHARTLQGDSWGGDGTCKPAKQEKQNHLQKLEDENANLRSLSRSLMKERQDLLNTLNSTGTELEELRTFCAHLKAQLNMVDPGQSGGHGMVKPDADFQSQVNTSHRTANGGFGDQGSGGFGGSASLSMDQSPMMQSSAYPQTMDVPPSIPETRSHSGFDAMASLSWMAPDFDLDEPLM